MRRRVCSGRRASVFSRRLFGEATFEQGFALRRFAGNARFGAVVCSLRHSSGKTRIVFGLTGRLQIIRSFPASAKVGRNSGVPGLMRIRYAIFAVLRIPSRGNRACRLLPEPAVRSLRRGPETAIPSFAARRNKGRVFAAAAFAPPDGARKRPNVGASDPRRPDTETVAFLSLRAGGSAKSGPSATGACCCARSQIREAVRFGSPGGCPRGFLLSDRVRYLQWLGGIRKDVFSLFHVSFFVVAEAMSEVRCRPPQRAATVRNTCRPSAGAGGFLFENSLQNVKFILRASEYN